MGVSKFSHLLAGDSWLPVVGGVKHVSQLQGGEQVLLVKPDGTIGPSTVFSVDRLHTSTPCVSLLTRVGELLLPNKTRIVTRRGVESIEDLVVASRTGQQSRLEIVQPADIFMWTQGTGSKRDAYRAALTVLSRNRIIVPGWLEGDSDVCDRIEDVLAVAATKFKRRTSGKWCIFDFDHPSSAPSVSILWSRTDAQQCALMLFRAWSLEKDQLVSRVLDGEIAYLQRLSGCFAASGISYDVKWLPGYRPVEARVSRCAGILGSHVPVLRIIKRKQEIYQVSIRSAGAMIVGLALIS
jgi:hypothetical protein